MGAMYLTLEGYTELDQDGKIVSNTRTIAYYLAFPEFPITPYTLYSSDDDVYYFSLSTQSGDITVSQLYHLYNYFYRYVFLINRAIISYDPPQLKAQHGMYVLNRSPRSIVCVLNHVDISIFSYRSNYITQNGRRMNNTELELIALQAIEYNQIDAKLAKRAYLDGRMSARGYWYVAA